MKSFYTRLCIQYCSIATQGRVQLIEVIDMNASGRIGSEDYENIADR